MLPLWIILQIAIVCGVIIASVKLAAAISHTGFYFASRMQPAKQFYAVGRFNFYLNRFSCIYGGYYRAADGFLARPSVKTESKNCIMYLPSSEKNSPVTLLVADTHQLITYKWKSAKFEGISSDATLNCN